VKSAGKFKIAAGGVGWKEAATGLVTTIPKEDFERLEWLRAMRGNQLRLQARGGQLHQFDGFPTEALRDLEAFSQSNWGMGLETPELSLKGHNWGRVEVEESRLRFLVGDKLGFDLNLKEASNVVQSAKDEIAVEFGAPGDASRRLDSLAEIRFYVPGAPKKEVDEIEELDASDNEEAKTSVAVPEDRTASLFAAIKAGTDLDAITGEMYTELADLPCLVPRGRYNLEMGGNFLRLHGKSYNYKILYSHLVKLFMVPRPDDTHVFFCMNIDPPIRQGQTRYPFIVLQFDRDEIMDLEMKNLTETELAEKYGGRLQSRYEGVPTFELVSTLFRVLAGQKILVPGGSYKGLNGASSLHCAHKATEGALYPLERNLLFLPKPPILLPHADISNIEFARIGSGMGNPRTFDFKVSLRSGTSYAFSNAQKYAKISVDYSFYIV